MDDRRIARRTVLASTGAAFAGCLGGTEDGTSDGDGNGSTGRDGGLQNGSTDGDGDTGTNDSDGTADGDTGTNDSDGTADGTASLDCSRIDAPYGRHDPGESAFVFTVELPDGTEIAEVRDEGLWKLKTEREIEGYTIEFELTQNGPKDGLSPRFRGEGEDPVVREIGFGEDTVPMVRYETGSWPQYLTGVPVPGSEGAFATVVTEVDVVDPAGAVVDDVCVDAINAMQRQALSSIEPNEAHTLAEAGADGSDGSG